MKSINVISEYTSFIDKNLKKTAKLILGRKYNEDEFSTLIDIYMKTRYYDSLERKRKSPFYNTTSYIKECVNKLVENSESPEAVIKVYQEVINFDFNNLSAKDLLSNIEPYKEELKIKDDIILTKLEEIRDEIFAKRKAIQKAFKTKDFICTYKGTNIRKVYNVELEYSFNIPKLYSDYAVNKVYESEIISEDRLYIEYYIVVDKLLKEIINFDYSNNYIVEFASTLLEKDIKLEKILNLVDNDICKEKIILKISFSDFKKHKDKVLDLINEGFNFAIIIDDTYEDVLENRKLITSVFKYIIIKRSSEKVDSFNEIPNLVRIK